MIVTSLWPACQNYLFARGKAIDRCKVMIYDAEVDPDAHAGSRGVGPDAKDKLVDTVTSTTMT